MAIEVELKLQIDPRHITRLRRHPLLNGATHTASRRIYSIYYDTPDLDLWRRGVALRLRRAGKRWIQTIKTGGNVAAGMHRRNEYEVHVGGKVPDFRVIDDGLAAHFAAPELRARLQPLMVTEFTRVSYLLKPAEGTVIEASIDRGTITSGDVSEPLCELELEVKSGSAWRAYETALQLLDSVPLMVEDRSKAERGIALYRHDTPAPHKAPPSPVDVTLTRNDAFKVLVQACLEHYVANQHGMLESGDPEYLHQARVALRRLRSVFKTFAPLLPAAALEALEGPAAETRWLARELGKARDWDVFAAETLAPVSARHDGDSGMTALARSASRERETIGGEARRAAASTRAQRLLLSLGGWLSAQTWLEMLSDAQRDKIQAPVAGFADTVLDAAFRRVSKRGRNLRSLTPQQLHRLRIAVKKLRYAGDFFAPLYPRNRTKPYLARLSNLQDTLGTINDIATAPQLLAALETPGVVPHEALDRVAAWSASLRMRQLKRLPREWQRFKNAAIYWKRPPAYLR